ncbi:MAG TPA: hypothetical protein VL945_00345 [Candidatus Saccharimonadales bacterium]|nr:hypothetical protein [Candidatus Saccharimonadales bacterium]
MGKRSLTEKEIETMQKAALIAALSSNHSWKTHKYLAELCELDKDGMSDEFNEALREGWKRINESDVEEVINGDFKRYLLHMWFYNAVDDDNRDRYRGIFNNMKKQLAYGLEPMEKKV